MGKLFYGGVHYRQIVQFQSNDLCAGYIMLQSWSSRSMTKEKRKFGRGKMHCLSQCFSLVGLYNGQKAHQRIALVGQDGIIIVFQRIQALVLADLFENVISESMYMTTCFGLVFKITVFFWASLVHSYLFCCMFRACFLFNVVTGNL